MLCILLVPLVTVVPLVPLVTLLGRCIDLSWQVRNWFWLTATAIFWVLQWLQ